MTKLIIFRHGMTTWNKEKRFQGHLDIPLSPEGEEQARELHAVLGPISFDYILTSDLSRAKKTAEIALGTRDVPMLSSPELREANLGEAQGKNHQEAKELWGENVLKKWFHATEDMKFPGGESKAEALVRFKNHITDFLAKHQAQSVAVSTHGYIIYRLLCQISDTNPENLTIKNCQAFEIDIDDEGTWHWVGTLN